MRHWVTHLLILFLVANQTFSYSLRVFPQFLSVQQDSTTQESSEIQTDTIEDGSEESSTEVVETGQLESEAVDSEGSSSEGITTSMGMIAEGVEKVDEDVSEFSNEFDSALKTLNSQIESTISMSSDLAITLIDAQIAEYENQLRVIDQHIEDLEQEIATAYDYCSDFDSCSSCTTSNDCVWCSSEQTCVSGDEEGPYESQCETWEHDSCSDVECEEYQTCSSCLTNSACGWCEDGMYCLSGSSENTGSCQVSYYYHSEAEGQDVCPVDTGSSSEGEDTDVDRYVNSNPTESIDQWILGLEEDLDEFRIQAAELSARIDDLEYSKEEIEEQVEAGLAIEMEDISVDHTLDGLGETVDTVHEEEMEEDREYQEELAESASNETISTTSEVIDENTDVVNEEIEDTHEYFMDEIDDLDEELSAKVVELEEDLEVLEASVDSTAVDESAESTTTETETTETEEESESSEESDTEETSFLEIRQEVIQTEESSDAETTSEESNTEVATDESSETTSDTAETDTEATETTVESSETSTETTDDTAETSTETSETADTSTETSEEAEIEYYLLDDLDEVIPQNPSTEDNGGKYTEAEMLDNVLYQWEDYVGLEEEDYVDLDDLSPFKEDLEDETDLDDEEILWVLINYAYIINRSPDSMRRNYNDYPASMSEEALEIREIGQRNRAESEEAQDFKQNWRSYGGKG